MGETDKSRLTDIFLLHLKELTLMHWGYVPPFGFLFFLILMGLIITNIVIWKRGNRRCYEGFDRARYILERRLASGEIDVEEYKKIKEHLGD